MNGKNQKGAALLIIAGIMVTISVVMDAVMIGFDSNLKSMEAFGAKKQAFYMSEGTRALVTVLLENFLMNNSDPTAAEISTYLNDSLVGLVPNPYTISPVQVEVLKVTPSAMITSGPFKGMNGPITDLKLKYNVQAPTSMFGGTAVEPLEMRLSVGYVSMFQFMAFYDVTQARIATGPPMDMNGRLHSNGDICVGGSGGFNSFLKVTVGGRLMNNGDARCGNPGSSQARIAIDNTFGVFATFTAAADNGCTNCGGTGLNWDAYALARWKEQALDTAHGVQLLKLPGAGEGQVQIRQAGNGPVLNNTDNLRFIVDPPLATDSLTVKSYKFAFNADIRIVNGVWYLRDPANPATWPGIPIWSDHPGRYMEGGFAVGQDDIRDRWAVINPWPAAPATPRHYSYYEYDAANQTIFDDPAGVGVISYGNLANSGAGATPQKPGHWINGGASSLCIGGAVLNCGGGGCGLKSVWQGAPYGCAAPIFPGSDPSYATNILNAARGGIRNGHVYQQSPGTAADRDRRSRILPLNIDISQLQDAIGDNGPGELGSFFSGPTSFMKAPFNGVVWISSVWPGMNSGYGAGSPTDWPWQGSINDGNQAATAHNATQQALPQPLCSDTNATQPGGLAGRAFDGQDMAGTPRVRFRVPDCASYAAAGAIQAWPNAVRVVNGATLNKAILTKGLSIVTNLPVYLTGAYNNNSNVAAVTSVPWTPSLVGGDKVILISNNWTDSRSRWDQPPSAFNRPATNTSFRTALLTEPSDTLTILLEDWTNRNLIVNGSMVYGYNAVYAQHDNYCCGNVTYDPPDRDFIFDPHYGLITNQPPGTPVFPISAIAVWTKSQ